MRWFMFPKASLARDFGSTTSRVCLVGSGHSAGTGVYRLAMSSGSAMVCRHRVDGSEDCIASPSVAGRSGRGSGATKISDTRLLPLW